MRELRSSVKEKYTVHSSGVPGKLGEPGKWGSAPEEARDLLKMRGLVAEGEGRGGGWGVYRVGGGRTKRKGTSGRKGR